MDEYFSKFLAAMRWDGRFQQRVSNDDKEPDAARVLRLGSTQVREIRRAVDQVIAETPARVNPFARAEFRGRVDEWVHARQWNLQSRIPSTGPRAVECEYFGIR